MTEFGTPEIAGLAVFAVMLERVFAFIKWNHDRKGTNGRQNEEAQIVRLVERQTDLMERIVPLVESIHATTSSYEKSGVCPWTTKEGEERAARVVAEKVQRGWPLDNHR